MHTWLYTLFEKTMTQEEKELLLKDLSARLPYRTFAKWHHKVLNKFRDVKIMNVSTYGKTVDDYRINVLCQPEPGSDYEASIIDLKPYLRPMSSMTEEEMDFANNEFFRNSDNFQIDDVGEMYTESQPFESIYTLSLKIQSKYFDWLNAHHFDYRGLIEKGLALEAKEGIYEKKKA